jgi:hypothetical protein
LGAQCDPERAPSQTWVIRPGLPDDDAGQHGPMRSWANATRHGRASLVTIATSYTFRFGSRRTAH